MIFRSKIKHEPSIPDQHIKRQQDELKQQQAAELNETLQKRRWWYALAIGLLIASALAHQGLMLLAALFVLIVAAIPEIWYRWGLQNLTVYQKLERHHILFGAEVKLHVSIEENRKLLPLPWLQVSNKIMPPLALATHTSASIKRKDTLAGTWLLWPMQRVTRVYSLRCLERGYHTFGPVELNSSDPLGWLENSKLAVTGKSMVVYPPIVPMESLGFSSVHPLGESVTPHALFEDPLRFAGVRDYAPGDDLRRVHWKATARAGEMRSKMYEPPALRRLLVVMDVWNYMPELHGADLELQELTITAAASLAIWGLEEGYQVGMLANCGMVTSPLGTLSATVATTSDFAGGDQRKIWPLEISAGSLVSIPYASEQGQYELLLETFGRLYPQNFVTLATAVNSADELFAQGTTVLLVTAANSLHETTVRRLQEMRSRRGIKVHLVLTNDEALPVATDGFVVHYLSGKEHWHEYSHTDLSATGQQGFQLD